MRRPPRPSPPMNTATTAAEAAGEAPKISRDSRVPAGREASAQGPRAHSRGATAPRGAVRGDAAVTSVGLGEIDLARRGLAAAHAGPGHGGALDRDHADGGARLRLDLGLALRGPAPPGHDEPALVGHHAP